MSSIRPASIKIVDWFIAVPSNNWPPKTKPSKIHSMGIFTTYRTHCPNAVVIMTKKCLISVSLVRSFHVDPGFWGLVAYSNAGHISFAVVKSFGAYSIAYHEYFIDHMRRWDPTSQALSWRLPVYWGPPSDPSPRHLWAIRPELLSLSMLDSSLKVTRVRWPILIQ